MSGSGRRAAAEAGYALFLDFDGTLVPIAPTPDAVRVDPALPDLLGALRRRLDGALAIVTGRPVAEIDRFLPGLGLDTCGLHGLDRRIGGEASSPALPDLAPEIDALEAELADRPGLLVEGKRVGVAVHWRRAPEAESDARAAIDRLLARLGPGYRAQDGKAVREIVPAGAGKGGAVEAVMARPPYLGRRPVMVGDDRTDEHAFAAVEAMGGVTIKVGPGETAARHRVASPAALRASLREWLAGGADLGRLPAAGSPRRPFREVGPQVPPS